MALTNHGRSLGYSRILTDGKVEFESDWVRCEHCQKTIHLRPLPPALAGQAPPPADEWGWCSQCDGKVCAACHDEMQRVVRCRNWERRLEEREGRRRLQDALTAR